MLMEPVNPAGNESLELTTAVVVVSLFVMLNAGLPTLAHGLGEGEGLGEGLGLGGGGEGGRHAGPSPQKGPTKYPGLYRPSTGMYGELLTSSCTQTPQGTFTLSSSLGGN